MKNPRVLFAALLVSLAAPLGAQSYDDPDFDTAAKPPNVIGPNSGADLVIRSAMWIDLDHIEIRANLVIEAGGHLRISRSTVRVFGDVVLKEGGVLRLSDSRMNLANAWPRQFNYFWRGGHLHTERVTIGGTKANGVPQFSNLWLNNGLWDALQTTVEYSGGILLGYGRQGYNSDPSLRGGTLRADGLMQGEYADMLHVSGLGDASLTNSVFNIGLFVYADGPSPLATRLDLSTKNAIAWDVYGDPDLHAGVTRPLPASPFRLQLANVLVPSWSLQVMNITMGGPPTELVLDNAESLICSLHGRNVTGSPRLGGDWSGFATAPGLPSTMVPGWHTMPAGASVGLGNVTFKAGGTPATILTWGLYLGGSETDVTISGACHIAEIWLEDGKLTLDGGSEYAAGLAANTIELHGTATLTIRNGAIGEFGTFRSTSARVAAHGRAKCVIDRTRISDVHFSTAREYMQNGSLNVDAASIAITNVIEDGNLRTSPSAGGWIWVGRAGPTEPYDLQNLDLDGAVQGNGAPAFWTVQSGSAQNTSERRPGTGGSGGVRYQSSSPAVAGMLKELRLSPGSQVQVFGWAKLGNASGSGVLDLRVEGNGLARKVLDGGSGVWRLLHVPTYTVGWEATTRVSLGASAAAAFDVSVDDVRVRVSNWWENDNLLNLDFDGGFRDRGRVPLFQPSPDGWKAWSAQCSPESSVRRPGAGSGTRSLKLVAQEVNGFIQKDLTFLAPGDRFTLTGWVRGDPAPGAAACYTMVQVGEGHDYWNTSNGVNKKFSIVGDGQWHSFTVEYVVPAAPVKQAFTRISVVSWGAPGNVLFADDFNAVISQ